MYRMKDLKGCKTKTRLDGDKRVEDEVTRVMRNRVGVVCRVDASDALIDALAPEGGNALAGDRRVSKSMVSGHSSVQIVDDAALGRIDNGYVSIATRSE